MRALIAALSVVSVVCAGCETGATPTNPIDPATDGGVTLRTDYLSIAALHETGIARTCGLNNGVCHNSKEYPDLHNLANLLDTVGQPCNANAASHVLVHDACEGQGDRLVIPSLGVDVEITSVAVMPSDAATADLGQATIKLTTTATVGGPAMDVEVHRGATVFKLVGATATVSDANTVTLDLGVADGSAKVFLDDRVYPWSPAMVRVADMNGNGILGRTNMPLIKPGDPMGSYLLLRLIDDKQGDLMPKQCRTWDAAATRALGCWIKGLKVVDGKVSNALDPIDYAACDFDPAGRGRCSDSKTGGSDGGVPGGFQAVQSIIAASCGGSGCHIGETQPSAGLDLTSGKVFSQLVGVPSTEAADLLRIAPGMVDQSYLACKIDESCAKRTGARMPLGGTLSPSDIAIVKAWISSGATQN